MVSKTLADGYKSLPSEVSKGIIETFVYTQPILEILPFSEEDQEASDNKLRPELLVGAECPDINVNHIALAIQSGARSNATEFVHCLSLFLLRSCSGRNIVSRRKETSITETLDQVIDSITSKEGEVDFILMSGVDIAKMASLCPEVIEQWELPSGRKIPSYSAVPIFKVALPQSVIIGGTTDDGSRANGIIGLYPPNDKELGVRVIGPDQGRWQTGWKVGAAIFGKNSLAVAK